MTDNAQGRASCMLTGCRRTTAVSQKDEEWICPRHWAAVPLKYRKLYTKAKRRYRDGRLTDERLARIWSRCKRQAFMSAWSV